ncbi:unnamed protein product [Rotaria sp. Silwood1]|nr:unnamed protein product [Rotaria sp. Silwood1]CAF1663243.1 unnamed protein product [Rotaria sp. Silwood1]
MIIGDRMAICVTANINDRLLVGNRDSELCIVINDLEEEDDRFNEELLLGIRFDIPNNIEVTDRVSDEFYSYFQDVAKQNTLIYEKVFATMKTQQTLKGIQGFVIEYLIYFLNKENYLPSMRTRENDSLSNRTGASLSPSIGDAPAASPEQSYILDLIHITNAHLDNMDIIQHSSSFYCDQDNSSILSILLNNISINKQPIKSNCLDFENTEKYLEENQCDCCRQYIENEKLTINEEQDDDNILKRKSKMSIYMNKFIWSYWNKFQKSISNFVAGKYFHRIVLSAIVINTLSMGIEYYEQPQS